MGLLVLGASAIDDLDVEGKAGLVLRDECRTAYNPMLGVDIVDEDSGERGIFVKDLRGKLNQYRSDCLRKLG